MNLLNKFFNKNPTKKNKKIPDIGATKTEMLSMENNRIYSWDGKVYQSDIIRACIRPKARAIGKLQPKHIRNRSEGLLINPELYIKFLLEEPNPLMSGQVMMEKVVTQFQLNNNAFIRIVRNENGLPTQLYPINCVFVEAKFSDLGELYLQFTLKNGVNVSYPYTDIIHLRQDVNDNDLFGEKPHDVLAPLMKIVTTTDQGLVNAIKNGNIIRWILNFKQILKKEDIQKEVKDFNDSYLNMEESEGGAIATDPKYEAKQVEPKDYVPNAAIFDKTVQRLLSYFNTNDKIIQNKYNEDDWNAYYEGEIEPFAIQATHEFTRKLFSRRDRAINGDMILFESANLQYTSMKTKLDLVAMVDRGALTPNKWLEIMNLPPVEGGDKPIRRLDTAVVSNNLKGGDE